ncbi:uncharacterized protein LOC129233357 [Uloborus diversus]|uniref:uncharacterized protein LOC129233357 n=1 Tax=Uloborus diversus TaxID=327109 RepID=UPI00240A85BA|nr:uncharacterized protein LOC129233357 [Uloborus diversus]
MKSSHLLVVYLLSFFVLLAHCDKYHGEYEEYEPKHHDYHHHHHDYHPPPKKAANVDITIPIDFGTIAKLGVIGLTQLKLLRALGKVAGAGLGVSALGLGQLGKIGLKVAPVHKGSGIAIDIGAGHSAKHYEEKHCR